MPSIRSEQSLSGAEDWFRLALPLVKTLQDPSNMGASTPTQIIANAARVRGLTPRALGKQIQAAKFLLQTYPDVLKFTAVQGGYSQVQYLAKIHQVSVSRADALVRSVLGAEVSMARMRSAYDEVVTSEGGPRSSSAKTKRRGIAFEAACEHAIRVNGEFFNLIDGAVLLAGHRFLDVALDYAVLRDGRVISAIEVRIGGLASAKREAFALLAKLALLASKVERVYLLVPAPSEELLAALGEGIRAWGIERVHVATVDERAPNVLAMSD